MHCQDLVDKLLRGVLIGTRFFVRDPWWPFLLNIHPGEDEPESPIGSSNRAFSFLLRLKGHSPR
jgi:hypothetical protein